MRVVLALLLCVFVGCDGGDVDPDGGDRADDCDVSGDAAVDLCESINTFPTCYADTCPCESDVRACDVDKLCQDWPDCVSSSGVVGPCFQCRWRYECECR